MENINIFRSWKNNFNHRDILDALTVYTHQELSEIRAHGYNGIWVRGELQKLTPSKLFAEFGQHHQEYLKTLQELVKRANEYKIGIYIYFNEPLALPARDRFWKKNNDAIGEKYYWPYKPKGYYYSLCTSTPQVREYIEDSIYLLFKKVQKLAGVIAITASEHISSCYSHIDILNRYKGKLPGVWKSVGEMNCLRCKNRSAAEVIADVLNAMYSGMSVAESSAKLIAWNWSWDLFYPDPQKEIISQLARHIIIMSDFERGGYKKILGKRRWIDEYSLSYIGPSEKFKKVYSLTRKTGHHLMVKLQVGTTHELASVPNLPLIGSLYKKLDYIKSKKIYGFMATWNMGNMRTLNTYAFGQALKKKNLTETAYYDIVRNYLRISQQDVTQLRKAWRLFAQAMDNYPFSVHFLYHSPINYSPTYWLSPRRVRGTPLGGSWMLEKRGDDLCEGIKGYGLNKVITAFELICRKWEEGIKIYKAIFEKREEKHAREELMCALAIGNVFRSTLHIYRLYTLCRKWDGKKYLSAYADLSRKELQNCQSLLPVLYKDNRIGFHAEAQGYMFNRKSVQGKIDMLAHVGELNL